MSRPVPDVYACLADLQLRGVTHLKAEFEAEGASSEEVRLLSSLANSAEMGIIVKIGGCEAVRDIRELLATGVESIVAPMIESAFAAAKFQRAVATEAQALEARIPELAINIESISGIQALHDILQGERVPALQRVVVGRTDLTDSLKLPSAAAESPEVATLAREVFKAAREAGLRTTLGGSVTPASVGFVNNLAPLVDSIETRKVLIPLSDPGCLEQTIVDSLTFEMAWLAYKSKELGPLRPTETRRLGDLESRLSA